MNKHNIIVVLSVSVIKLVLFLICRRYKTPSVDALSQDHRNDVLSNTLALACGYIGMFRRIKSFLWHRFFIIDVLLFKYVQYAMTSSFIGILYSYPYCLTALCHMTCAVVL